MIGMAMSTKAESFGLVKIIRPTAPTNRNRLRRASAAVVLKAAFICVVSAVSRDINSPMRAVSKKAASRRQRCAKTAERRSATSRSPSVVTK